MQSDILNKLNIQLSKEYFDEPKVLYILAEIRKYIDEYEKTNKQLYKYLYFFCDWVLHIKMDRKTAKLILNNFESKLGDLDKINLKEIAQLFIHNEGSFYLFTDLKNDFINFLEYHSLPKDIIISSNKWDIFTFNLIKILTDCYLENIDGKLTKFSFENVIDGTVVFRLKVKNKGSIKFKLKRSKYKILSSISYIGNYEDVRK